MLVPGKQVTFKQEKFAQELVGNGGNATQAAVIAYPGTTLATHSQIATENMRKPRVIDRIQEICTEKGFGPDKALGVLCVSAQDVEDKRWALPLYFDVTGLKAPQKIEHKVEFAPAEEGELMQMRAALEVEGKLVD